MIIIRVELKSARTGETTEIARMHITNTGEVAGSHGNYVGKTFRGRSSEALDKLTVARGAEVDDWPRHRFHVWKLIAKMLATMGY